VYRWKYDGQRADLGEGTHVLTGIDHDFEGSPGGTIPGNHPLRMMEFDSAGRMYVHTGAKFNLDVSSTRGRIMRFEGMLNEEVVLQTYEEGELFADGVRNENGLTFQGVGGSGFLWGVENERDQLVRDDFSDGSIYADNPSEELNKFDPDAPGRFYGYPYCWTEYELSGRGLGRGTQWAERGQTIEEGYVLEDYWGLDPRFPEFLDEECQDPFRVVPPVVPLQGHSAPLGLDFYREDVNANGALPADWVGDLFIAYHGSWNKAPTTGYKVVHIPFDANGNPEVGPNGQAIIEDIFYNANRDFGGVA
jgi:glucose/arabinose dehydrogenase